MYRITLSRPASRVRRPWTGLDGRASAGEREHGLNPGLAIVASARLGSSEMSWPFAARGVQGMQQLVELAAAARGVHLVPKTFDFNRSIVISSPGESFFFAGLKNFFCGGHPDIPCWVQCLGCTGCLSLVCYAALAVQPQPDMYIYTQLCAQTSNRGMSQEEKVHAHEWL